MCLECASVHRSMGRNISQVTSLRGGAQWISEQLTMIKWHLGIIKILRCNVFESRNWKLDEIKLHWRKDSQMGTQKYFKKASAKIWKRLKVLYSFFVKLWSSTDLVEQFNFLLQFFSSRCYTNKKIYKRRFHFFLWNLKGLVLKWNHSTIRWLVFYHYDFKGIGIMPRLWGYRKVKPGHFELTVRLE